MKPFRREASSTVTNQRAVKNQDLQRRNFQAVSQKQGKPQFFSEGCQDAQSVLADIRRISKK